VEINELYRNQMQMECLEEFVEQENEVRIIDKIVDTFKNK